MNGRLSPRVAAVEKLENYIKVNHLPANSRIPSERDMCEEWGINRTTFRLAVDELVERGRLYRKKGSGTYVTEHKIKRNLLGVDSLATAIREEGYNFTTTILSKRVIECNKQISRRLRVPLGSKIYESIRLRSIDGVPCIIETTCIDSNQCPGFDQYDLEKTSMYSIFKNIYKKKIVSGEEEISVTYTTEDEGKLLGVPEGTPIFYAVGVTELENHQPLEYYRALFRADRFKFTSVIQKAGDGGEQ